MSTAGKRDAIYITYDGILEPIGRSQIVPYVRSLAGAGVRIEIVSFEKPADLRDFERVAELRRYLEAHDVRWHALRYHGRPKVFSTGWDVLFGTVAVWRRFRASCARLVHVRSYVPCLMGLVLKGLTGARLLFDMRGFWPEERVELGIFLEAGFLYRATKWLEALFLAASDRIVVLTRRAKETLLAREGTTLEAHVVEVIPCCVDLGRFKATAPAERIAGTHNLSGSVVLGNIGAINRRYLLRETFRLARLVRDRIPNLRFVYLTQQDPTALFEASEAEGLPRAALVVASASPDEIPAWLSLFEFGIYFLKTGYAARASNNTKLAEFLAAGVPVVTNRGVGDIEEIITEATGVLLDGLTDAELARAAAEIVSRVPVSPATREQCRIAARKHFDLEDGCARYLALYRSLLLDEGHRALATTRQSREVS